MTDERTAISRRGILAAGTTVGAGVFLGTALAQDDEEGEEEDDESEMDDDRQGGSRNYRVTVTNLTRGQPFTPPAVAVHRPDVEVFSVGDPANEPTQQIAENGNLEPLLDLIESTNSIRDAAVGDAPLVPESDPGETGNPYFTTLHLSADASATHLTFISMLIATNDGIVGLDTVELPDEVNESRTYYANGYDVGTEQNTEMFADLVPPAQTLIRGSGSGGTDQSDPDIAEDGVITPHPGIEGDGDLNPDPYDWREPAAVVQVERLEELQQEFQTTLSGDNEVPPVETDASGEATFEVEDDGEELSYEVTVSDIEDVVAAHIHCGRANVNGPVGVTLYDGDPVSDDGVLTDGTISEPDEDNDCGWETLDDVLAAMRGSRAYVNVHTQENPGGEIRGQIR